MFSPDVVSLKQFYASPLGRAAREHIENAIGQLWPDASGDALLAVGYPMPYLGRYLAQAAPAIAGMPAHQGALYWPAGAANRVVMMNESEWPLAENSLNRLLFIHSLENSEQLTWLMQEAWRVLTPGGRLLAVVPNRLSLWARSSRSPFGYGRPFSMAQLRDLLGTQNFTITRTSSALFVPPVRWQWLWRLAPKIERIGKTLCGFLGGVLIIEAEKQLYAPITQPVLARKRYTRLAPAAKPVMGRRIPLSP